MSNVNFRTHTAGYVRRTRRASAYCIYRKRSFTNDGLTARKRRAVGSDLNHEPSANHSYLSRQQIFAVAAFEICTFFPPFLCTRRHSVAITLNAGVVALMVLLFLKGLDESPLRLNATPSQDPPSNKPQKVPLW